MENIQVAVRIRPDPEPSIWTLQDSHVILNAKELLSRRPLQGVRKYFKFCRHATLLLMINVMAQNHRIRLFTNSR